MIARTARIVFHRNGSLIAAGAVAHDKRGLCVACIVTWRQSGGVTGYVRIDPTGIDDEQDLFRFMRAASEGALRSDMALAADYDRIETLSKHGFHAPAGMAAALALHIRSQRIALHSVARRLFWRLDRLPRRAA